MKTYITRINGWGLRNRSHYMQYMMAEIAHRLGCREMGIYRYYADNESYESLSSRLDGIIAGINRGDLVICQFPTGNGIRFERELVNRLKAYGGRIAIYIHEVEALAWEEKKDQAGETAGLYNLAEILVVQTYEMRNWLLEHGIHRNMKFVVQEMWDYPVQEPIAHTPAFKKEICFTDNEGFAGMNNWDYAVPLKLYNVSADPGKNVQNLGEREPYQLLSELSEGGFGLVWYRNEYSHQYMKQSSSFSLARYLAAGIPVIIPAESSHRTTVEVNHLGFVADTLEEAVAAVEKMTEGEYREYTKAVEQFAPALRRGYYTKKCLIETMQAFYRKDVGKTYIPSREYSLKECIFSTSVLNESYGGGLALSWRFQGKADGFLIYDVSGRMVYETKNMLQHYYWIEGCRKEAGFIVKAYVETLKGKMIVAESSPVYHLHDSQYKKPEVSLIIPAYNAEDYVARAIDTALAQSFFDLEIIIVDDGSIDHTPDIIDWYAQKYPNVRAVHQENGGAAAARNTGIKNADGNYIGFMDSDDMLRPDMIRRLYHSIRSNDCDIVCTSIYMILKDGYREFLQCPMQEDTAVTIENFLQMYLDGKAIWGVCVVNKLYRASLVKDHLFPIITSEDEAWTPYILSYADRICYLNALSYEYDRTIRSGTLVDSWTSRSKDEVFRIHVRTVLFYLRNSNPKMMHMLKKMAKRGIYEWGRVYGYANYEKIWNKIDGCY